MGNEPEVIMQNMEDTRNALTEKLENLEQQVVDTVQGATTAVADTVETVKAAVQETVDQVKDSVQATVGNVRETVSDTVHTVQQTFDLKLQAEHRPWVVFGGAVAVGFVAGWLLTTRRQWTPRVAQAWKGMRNHKGNGYTADAASMAMNGIRTDEVANRMSEASEPVSVVSSDDSTSTAAAALAGGASLVQHAVDAFEPEINKLKGLAIGSLMGSIRHLVVDQIPDQFRPQVGDVFDSMTRKLGGEPIHPA